MAELRRKTRTLEREIGKIGGKMRRIWDKQRAAVARVEQKYNNRIGQLEKKEERLKKTLRELQNSCKSRFHPKLDVVGSAKCPDCGLVRSETSDYSGEAHT